MSDAKIVKLAETEVVSFGPLAHYQPIIGDDEGTTPVRTGIQTSQPGYVAPVHSHPYLEILHILDGTAEAWLEGREDEKVVLGKGDTIALPPGAPHSFFDRKASQYEEAAESAWREVLKFIRRHTAGQPFAG